jgi:hypothetical protein
MLTVKATSPHVLFLLLLFNPFTCLYMIVFGVGTRNIRPRIRSRSPLPIDIHWTAIRVNVVLISLGKPLFLIVINVGLAPCPSIIIGTHSGCCHCGCCDVRKINCIVWLTQGIAVDILFLLVSLAHTYRRESPFKTILTHPQIRVV